MHPRKSLEVKRQWVTLRCFCLFVMLGSLLGPLWARGQDRVANLVRNGGFEGGSGPDGRGGGVPEWLPYGQGYDIDRRFMHGGEQCIRCDSTDTSSLHGAMQTIELNQQSPVPIVVVGWSRADSVEGNNPADYAIYVDLTYNDGTPLWGQVAAFSAGTHDWEREQLVIYPEKPVKSLTLYMLFRYHRGTVWFDDVSLYLLRGPHIFDGQLLDVPTRPQTAAPWQTLTSEDRSLSLTFDARGTLAAVRVRGRKMNGAAVGGFLLRDVGNDGPLIPLEGRFTPRQAGGVNFNGVVSALHVVFSIALYPKGNGIGVDGTLIDKTGQDRALSLYLTVPFAGSDLVWGEDIQRAFPVEADEEYENQVQISVGTTGGLSRYPFACVAGRAGGFMMAEDIQWPAVFRIFYNAPHHLLVIGWDVALTGKSQVWPTHTARVRCELFSLPPLPVEQVGGRELALTTMPFREAAMQFYRANALFYPEQHKPYGIWMPFTAPESVEGWPDFGFAFHEGDNSIKQDNAAGILCFRYIEPSSYWMPMADNLPRTYEEAMSLIQARAKEAMPPRPLDALHDPTPQEWARAVLNSGVQDSNGRFYVQFSKVPWNDGALFILNPSPGLPATPEQPTKASLSYTVEGADRLFGAENTQKNGRLDGIYLDSLESWADTCDYRLSDLQACPYPLTFDSGFRKPCVPQWYWVHDFTRFVSADLHNRGRLLMANSTPERFCIFAPLLDVMGSEVNWLYEGRFFPDSDALLCYRRTLCYQKPFLMLMDTNFDRFDHSMVEQYFQRCLFYDLFPSMFSADASTHPYWETPKWYNRDRDLFKRYIPLFQQLSAAGWQPLTWAIADNPSLRIERYGDRFFTISNTTARPQDGSVYVFIARVPSLAGARKAVERLAQKEIPLQNQNGALLFPIALGPHATEVVELR
ncbi:hypothetical protein CWRG_02766 [Chthonomonas calidirosea]|uniref:hypothetical protein n=1 Tax=Chthonomonas calidirosea TaxID=454171 RepID=UPI0006DD51F5|nr:hypothetical protein [Chthonomonas calidirosea]CEK20233.1 hypothetical protein CWRG_02766 [Chthonomonas calidirosea]